MDKSRIKFRQLFEQYLRDRGGFFQDPLFLPKCKVTKTDIFGELDELYRSRDGLGSSLTPPNIECYIKFLLSIDDVDNLVCYKEYNKTFAKGFEKKLRSDLINGENASWLYAYMNIPKRFRCVTFDNSRQDGAFEKQRPLFRKTVEFCSDYKDSLLLCTKQVGTGKSHLLVCSTIQFYIERGYIELLSEDKGRLTLKRLNIFPTNFDLLNSPILYLNEGDLYFMLISTFKDQSSVTEFQIFKHLVEIPYLAIDDIYYSGNRNFLSERLARIIHTRVDENMLPTAISTNYTLHELRSLDKRVASRLERGRVYSANPSEQLPDYRSIK